MSEYLAMSCDDVEWGGCENHNGGRGRLPLGYVSNRVGESRGTLGGGGMQGVFAARCGLISMVLHPRGFSWTLSRRCRALG